MKLALALLCLVALATAAPENYTSHFQMFQASSTDSTLSSSNTTIDADGAGTTAKSTHGASGNTSVATTFAADDEISDTGGTTEVPSKSTNSTNNVKYLRGGVSSVTAGASFVTEGTTVVTNATTNETKVATESTFTNGSTSKGVVKFGTSDFAHSTDGATSTDGDKDITVGTTVFATDGTDGTHVSSGSTDGVTRTMGGASQATTGASNATDEVTKPSIGVTAHSDVTNETVDLTTEVVSNTSTEGAYDGSSTNASIKTETGVQTTTMTPTDDHTRSVNQGNSTKNGNGEVEDPGFGFTFKLPSFFATIFQTVSTIGSESSNTISSDTSINVHRNGGSNVHSTAQSLNETLISDSTKTTTTGSPFVAVSDNTFGLSGAHEKFIPSSSIDAASSNPSVSGINFLSTSDLNNQQTRLPQDNSTLVKKSLSESKIGRNKRTVAYSGLDVNPDYYISPFTAVGRDNSDAYDYDYYSQAFPPVRTPEEDVVDYSQSTNSGGYSGQFQYIIKTSKTPGELESFQTSSSLSALHPNSPDTYSSIGSSLTGSQTDVGHVLFSSQLATPFSLFPAFQSSSNFNFSTNQRPSFGFLNFLGGSSIEGHLHTNADSASVTQKPVETFNSTTTMTSITSHTSHQQNESDSFSETHRTDKTYYSTTTEASITPKEKHHSLPASISESSNNGTRSSSTTYSPLFDSSKLTTEIIDGAEQVTTAAEGIEKKDTSNPKVGTNTPVKSSKVILKVQ